MPEGPSGRVGRSSVEAVFADLRQARAAIDDLEAHGIDAGEITLEGKPIERAAFRGDTRPRDARVTRHVGKRAGIGLVIGGIAGGLIGVIVSSMATSSALAIMAVTLASIVAGGAIGLMVGGVSSIDVTPDWELTFEPAAGPVVVEVTTDDPSEATTATNVLSERHPRDLHRPA